jgi:hypothetical protein
MGTTSATAFHTPGVLLRLLNAFAVFDQHGFVTNLRFVRFVAKIFRKSTICGENLL